MSSTSSNEPLSFVLFDTARLLRAAVEQAIDAAGLEITPGEARVLLNIDLLDIPRQTAIADRMGIEPMTLSGYVDRLEAIGFVVREPDPDDRRAKIVRLTPSGETMVQAVRPVTRRLMEEILAPLGSNGSDRLRDMIEPVRQSLRQRRGAGPAGR